MLQTFVESRPAVVRQSGERLPTVRVKHVTARAVVQPKPDVALFAKAIWQFVAKQHEGDS